MIQTVVPECPDQALSYGFYQGDLGEIGRSRIPIARTRFVNAGATQVVREGLRRRTRAYLRRNCHANPIGWLAEGFGSSSPTCPARQSVCASAIEARHQARFPIVVWGPRLRCSDISRHDPQAPSGARRSVSRALRLRRIAGSGSKKKPRGEAGHRVGLKGRKQPLVYSGVITG